MDDAVAVGMDAGDPELLIDQISVGVFGFVVVFDIRQPLVTVVDAVRNVPVVFTCDGRSACVGNA